MGAGIAQLAALGGYETCLHDPEPRGARARGPSALRDDLAKGAERGPLERLPRPRRRRRALHRGRRGSTTSAGCELVIEAAPEDLELKRELFARLAEICGPGRRPRHQHLLALGHGDRRRGRSRPERVCGMHFFNPRRADAAGRGGRRRRHRRGPLDDRGEVARAMGREPVRAADAIGFVANRCARARSALEALRLLGERIADPRPDRPDHAHRRRLPHGPVRAHGPGRGRRQLRGREVVLGAGFHEPRWQPHPIQERMVAAGRLGRKAGRGFYDVRAADPHRADDPAAGSTAAGARFDARSRDRGRSVHWSRGLPGPRAVTSSRSRLEIAGRRCRGPARARRSQPPGATSPGLGKHVEWAPGDAPGLSSGGSSASSSTRRLRRRRGGRRRRATSTRRCGSASTTRAGRSSGCGSRRGRVVDVLDRSRRLGEERYGRRSYAPGASQRGATADAPSYSGDLDVCWLGSLQR